MIMFVGLSTNLIGQIYVTEESNSYFKVVKGSDIYNNYQRGNYEITVDGQRVGIRNAGATSSSITRELPFNQWRVEGIEYGSRDALINALAPIIYLPSSGGGGSGSGCVALSGNYIIDSCTNDTLQVIGYQTLTQSNDTIYLSDGGFVVVPSASFFDQSENKNLSSGDTIIGHSPYLSYSGSRADGNLVFTLGDYDDTDVEYKFNFDTENGIADVLIDEFNVDGNVNANGTVISPKFYINGASYIGSIRESDTYEITNNREYYVPDVSGFFTMSVNGNNASSTGEVTLPNYTGWASYNDSTTTTSPQVIAEGDTARIMVNKSSVIETYLPSGVDSLYARDANGGYMIGQLGSTYNVRINFDAQSSSGSGYAYLIFDIGTDDNAPNIINSRIFTFPKGASDYHSFSFTTSVFALSTFVANGCKFKISSGSGITDIANINVFITKTTHPN